MGAKVFELLDVPKFAVPNVTEISADRTSSALQSRLGGKGFMSYGQIWPRMNELVRNGLTEDDISCNFAAYKDEWKNKSIQEAARLLQQMMGGKGTWYRDRSPPAYVLGVWFKTSIKGIWFSEGRSHAVLVNPRKGQVRPLQISGSLPGVFTSYIALMTQTTRFHLS